MKRPTVPYKWVRVWWKDIAGHSGWGDGKEATTEKCYTEGWLIRDDPDAIVVSNSVSLGESREFANRDAIPRGAVIEIDYGRVAKPDNCAAKPNNKEEGK